MSRDVRVVGYCDTCHLKGVERPAITTLVVSLGVDTPGDLVALDLCGLHLPVWAACLTLATEAGRAYDERERPLIRDEAPRKRPVRQGGRMDKRCPECRAMVDVRSLPNHLAITHGVKRPRMPGTCPDCGLSTNDRTAMLRHRSRTHGYSVTQVMLAEWKGTR